MPDERKFEVRSASCRRLADLAGIKGDLQLCVKACDELLSSAASEPSKVPNIMQEALAEYAIFRYCRTISSDVRSGVSIEQIQRLSPDLQKHHTYIKALRDKHLAHSVNYREENSVHATISLDSTATLLRLGTKHSRTPTTSYKDMQNLKELAESLREIVAGEYQIEFDKTWTLLESMSPQERLLNSEVPPAPRKFRSASDKRPKASGG